MSKAPQNLPKLGTLQFNDYTLDLDYWMGMEFGDFSQAAHELPIISEWLNDLLQYYVATEIVEYRKVKQLEAETYFRLRNGDFTRLYGDKMTEKALEYAVELDKDLIAAVESYATAKAWTVRLRNTISVLNAKLDMLRTSEATRRHIDNARSPS